MLIYCLKHTKKQTGNVNSKVLKTESGRTMLSSTCALFCSKKSRFMRAQEANGLLSSIGLKTILNKILLLGKILF